MTVADTWDLESIFAGGSASAGFRDFVAELERDVARAGERVRTLDESAPDAEVRAVLLDAQAAEERLDQAFSFAECLRAQNTADAEAVQWVGRVDALGASLKALGAALSAFTARLADERWRTLTESAELRPVAFLLSRERDLARRKLDARTEGLVEELAADGYHAWDRQYTTLAGSLRAEVEVDGESRRLSMGQLAARLEEPARADREAAFEALEGAWRPVADLAAGALNSQAGFRLTWYRHRGWDSVLDEPLYLNRMEARSLDAMWAAVADGAARLVPYLQAKARLIGVDAPCWYDIQAPVGAAEDALSFDAAATRILDCFEAHDPDLSAFARHAYGGRWIEAADRAGKAAGGFCTTLPLSRQTRIFMTYGGTFGGATTLAHELGHAHHSWLLCERPYYATSYPMTLAETASTLLRGPADLGGLGRDHGRRRAPAAAGPGAGGGGHHAHEPAVAFPVRDRLLPAAGVRSADRGGAGRADGRRPAPRVLWRPGRGRLPPAVLGVEDALLLHRRALLQLPVRRRVPAGQRSGRGGLPRRGGSLRQTTAGCSPTPVS